MGKQNWNYLIKSAEQFVIVIIQGHMIVVGDFM